MKIEYDKEADALYVTLREVPYAYGKDLDNERRIDYAPDGTPRGIEITCVSRGINLDKLPSATEIATWLRSRNIKEYA